MARGVGGCRTGNGPRTGGPFDDHSWEPDSSPRPGQCSSHGNGRGRLGQRGRVLRGRCPGQGARAHRRPDAGPTTGSGNGRAGPAGRCPVTSRSRSADRRHAGGGRPTARAVGSGGLPGDGEAPARKGAAPGSDAALLDPLGGGTRRGRRPGRLLGGGGVLPGIALAHARDRRLSGARPPEPRESRGAGGPAAGAGMEPGGSASARGGAGAARGRPGPVGAGDRSDRAARAGGPFRRRPGAGGRDTDGASRGADRGDRLACGCRNVRLADRGGRDPGARGPGLFHGEAGASAASDSPGRGGVREGIRRARPRRAGGASGTRHRHA